MKILKYLPLVIVALFATQVVEGAPFAGLPGVGSKAGVEHYAATNSTWESFRVYQKNASGVQIETRPQFGTNATFSSKAELDAFFIQMLTYLAEGALTNQMVNKDMPFRISAGTGRVSTKLGIIGFLRCSKEFVLTKSSDGSYHLPDFARLVSLELYGSVLYEVDDPIEFGRVEVRDANGFLFWETDTRINPQEYPADISLDYGYVEIRTDWLIATNGTTTKVMLGLLEGDQHAYKVVKDGKLVSETPITTLLSPIAEDGTTTLTINGGDPGRVVRVQVTSDLCTWYDVGGTMVVPRYGAPLKFQQGTYGSSSGFYRIRTANVKPYWPAPSDE